MVGIREYMVYGLRLYDYGLWPMAIHDTMITPPPLPPLLLPPKTAVATSSLVLTTRTRDLLGRDCLKDSWVVFSSTAVIVYEQQGSNYFFFATGAGRRVARRATRASRRAPFLSRRQKTPYAGFLRRKR